MLMLVNFLAARLLRLLVNELPTGEAVTARMARPVSHRLYVNQIICVEFHFGSLNQFLTA